MKNRILFPIAHAIAVFVVFTALAASIGAVPSPAYADGPWRDEFDELCSKTMDAMELTTDELKSLADRCDRLLPKIEQLDETERKVFKKRLLMCRDLYLYVIETREKK